MMSFLSNWIFTIVLVTISVICLYNHILDVIGITIFIVVMIFTWQIITYKRRRCLV